MALESTSSVNTTTPTARQQFLQRDGQSQAGHIRPFLDPQYAAVDERTLKDLLAFAREYGKELRYFDVINEKVEAVGDWRDFLSSDIDLNEVVAFMQDPASFTDEQKRPYTRPHFTLFLTFLHLLSYAQEQLNTLTERHLDFYYQQVLLMNKRAGRPDQVNVLVDTAPTTEQYLLPQGTLLNAGSDNQGQDLAYRTDEDIVVTHAQVAKLSSVFAEKQITGIPDARKHHPGTKEEKIIKLFEMAFGLPDPGDPIPPFTTGADVDYALLQKLAELVNFPDQVMRLHFDELRLLIRLKAQRDSSAAEWNKINTILQRAIRTRTGDTAYKFTPQNPQDFDANLRTALGNPPDFDRLFDGIQEVTTIYDAYNKRNRQDLQAQIQTRIQERLYLPVTAANTNDFTTLIQTKMRIDNEWQEINRILAEAGRSKGTLQAAVTFPAPAHLRVHDIVNWPGFLTKLVNENHTQGQNPGKRLWAFLHDDLQDDIENMIAAEQVIVEDDDKLDIILAFNEILLLADFYQAESFASLTLSPEIQDLLNQDRASLSSFEVQKLNRLLLETAYPGETNHSPIPLSNPADFLINLRLALGEFEFPEQLQTIEDYFAAIEEVERFFFMTAENFAYMMYVVKKEVTATAVSEPAKPTQREWDRVYDILVDAHKEQVYAQRRQQLKETREENGFEAMLNLALGISADDVVAESRLNRLKEILSPADAQVLDDIQQRVNDNTSITAAEWTNVYRIAELAQRTFLDEPVARKEEWLNLYAAADATAVTVDLGIASDKDNPRWRTFGQGQPLVESGTPAPTEIGWALSSPLLALHEGTRSITLTLGFTPDQFDTETIQELFSEDSPNPFRIEVTTEKGWIQTDEIEIAIGDYASLSAVAKEGQAVLSAIQIKLTFPPNVDPIAPLPAEDVQIVSEWPQLRIMLRQIWQPQSGKISKGRYITHYKPFQNLILRQTHIKVAAVDVTPTQIQNDETTFTPGKPFEPFGLQANAGARLLFGHPELITKRLDSLKFHMQWMGAPANLAIHYANYDATPAIKSNESFTARIALVDDRVELNLADENESADYGLFDKENANNAHTVSIPDLPAAISNGSSHYNYQRASTARTGDDLAAWNRYILWELNEPDFQHDTYPNVAMQKSVALAAAISNQTVNDRNVASFQVIPPYTPKIKSLTFDYTASAEIDLASYDRNAPMDRLFHLQPFGFNEMQRQGATQNYLFLPQFDFAGELYIGIANAILPQNLSLLFQMAEGSANPDFEPVPIQWSYLSGNQWKSLDEGNLLQDSTRGLINSGIIKFALEPIRPSTLLPANYYWLRAAIPLHSSSVCDTVAIHAQAVSATFFNQNNAPDHLNQPLAPGSISDLQEPLPDVTGIRQPYSSYGGKMAEQSTTFYTRISERLRHKNRALTVWDYEQLILEHFPQIYKVKCLPTTPDNPGLVEIITIPNIKNKIPFNPFEPKAPADLIADIEAFLADKIPAFATVKVKNATFVPVKVRFGVRFLPGYNEGFYKQQLNEDINRFLAPWAYEDGADIVIGSRIYANVLINFIEERPYVDFVAEIKLFSSEDHESYKMALPSGTDGYWVQPNRPDGVLVAASQHEIDMIPESGYEEDSFTGINYMKIELDFIVGE